MVGKTGRRQSRIPDFSERIERATPPPPKQDGGSRAPTEKETAMANRPTAVPIGVVEEIKTMLSDLVGAVTQLTARMDVACEGAEAVARRMEEAEGRISTLEDEVAPIRLRIETLERQVKAAHTRLEDQEGRSRRANVRILGVPEGVEGPRAAEFVELLIKEALPKAQLSPFFMVERAHRSLQARPPPGAPPRPMIAKLLNFRDRDVVLAAARIAEKVQYKAHKLSFYPDYTIQVQGLRKQFVNVKAALRARNIKYSIMHPAKIRFVHANKTHFYSEPERAMEYIERAIPTHRSNGSSRGGSHRSSPMATPNANTRREEILAVLETVARNTGGTTPGKMVGSSSSTVSSLERVMVHNVASPLAENGDSNGLGDWILSTPPQLREDQHESGVDRDDDAQAHSSLRNND